MTAPGEGTPEFTAIPGEALPENAPPAVEPEQPEPATGPVEPSQPVRRPGLLFVETGPAVLSVVPPAGSLTVDDVVITTEPTPVSSEIAARARDAAWLAGIDLKEH